MPQEHNLRCRAEFNNRKDGNFPRVGASGWIYGRMNTTVGLLKSL